MSAFERLKEWSDRFAATDTIAAEVKVLIEEVETLRVLHQTDHGLADLRERQRDNAEARLEYVDARLEKLEQVREAGLPIAKHLSGPEGQLLPPLPGDVARLVAALAAVEEILA